LKRSAAPRNCRRLRRKLNSTKRSDGGQGLSPPIPTFALAYNEFCSPTVEESIEELIRQGATHITVATTMFTPGGAHSEVEIPEILTGVRAKHPEVAIHYAWPFDASTIAHFMNEQVRRFMS
jgi:hypothetical protein